MDKFEILRDYTLIVRRGWAKPIVCGADDQVLTIRLNDGITPKLQCYYCGSDYYPSDHEYAKWQEQVEERLK